MYRAAKILLILCLGWSFGLSAAGYSSPDRDAEGNIVPTPKGEVCIAPVEEMRRDHMTMLRHQRDKTVQQGIRDQQASLTDCIDCHVTPDASGTVARITDKRHFCASCHLAVSVKIDCFECHADRPAEMISRPGSIKNAFAVAGTRFSLPYAAKFRLDAAPGTVFQ
jgi:hypothetical protein